MTAAAKRIAAAVLALASLAPRFLPAACAHGEAWLQTSIPGFTVYTDLSEAETRRRLAALLVAIDDFSRVWPTPQADNTAPALIVFCGQPILYPTVSPSFIHHPLLLHEPADAFLNTHYTPWDGYLPKLGGTGQRGYYYKYPPLLDYWGDHLLQRAYSAYFQQLMGEREPAWHSEGLGKLMQGMCCRDGAIELPALTTDPTLAIRQRSHGSKASLQQALARGDFFPLDDLLTRKDGPPAEQPHFFAGHNGHYTLGPDNRSFWNTVPYGPFLDEAYEFTYFGLFADGGMHRAGFIRFALAASNGPLDEAAIRNCLGMEETELLIALWRCTAFASDQVYHWPPRSGPEVPSAASLSFRPATEQDLAKMMQTWSAAKPVPMARGSRSSSSGQEDLYNALRTLY